MHFTKIRVSGFKSFIDATELPIGPGITGIVGPNGCGKSNIVEALRWAMGETSAKRMRGGEMDDVIFGGSDSRPARNIAEVLLHLDNADHTAPAPFNDADEIEVTRRIERGSGSNYRVNGKEVRARDVQLLFADIATGAHSTAMVSQGRVSALIDAKPIDRRVLLEEAAGIRGLHSRRHEAELRLSAAEDNLERLEDIIGVLEGQHQGLQRQVRQAIRYRRVAENIRRHEGMLLYLRWQTTCTAEADIRGKLAKAAEVVSTCTASTIAAKTNQAKIAAKLPELRQRENSAAAELQRLVFARSELDRETARMAQARDEVDLRLEHITADIERERILSSDAAKAINTFGAEMTVINTANDAEDIILQNAEASCDTAIKELVKKDQEVTALQEYAAEVAAKRASLEHRLDELSLRKPRLNERCDDLRRQHDELVKEVEDDRVLKKVQKEFRYAEEALIKFQSDYDLAEDEQVNTQKKEEKTRANLSQAESRAALLEAKVQALMELTGPAEESPFASLNDDITVNPGYELALGIALGDDLNATENSEAPIHWTLLPPLESTYPLPGNIDPLSLYVTAPEALSRRLNQTGVVAATVDGKSLQNNLKPGQRIVSLDGALWRWDGYTITAGTKTASATKLEQRNQLKKTRDLLKSAKKEVEKSKEANRLASAANSKATKNERQLREYLTGSLTQIDTFRAEHEKLLSRTVAAKVQIANLQETILHMQSEISEINAVSDETNNAILNLEDLTLCNKRSEDLQEEIHIARAIETERRNSLNKLTLEAEIRTTRKATIEQELEQWNARAEGARRRINDLETRLADTETDRTRLEGRPGEIKEQLNTLLDTTKASEKKRNLVADELAAAEAALTKADRELSGIDNQLAKARETHVRIEAQYALSVRDSESAAEQIGEELDCSPVAILENIGVEAHEIPDVEKLATRLERLKRERDNMGPINLRAETEALALEEQAQSMQSEREELLAAISRLRQGIAALNREGRDDF